MVSGVGPESTLAQYHVPVVANRPGVGTNLWDHVLCGPTWRVQIETHSAVSDPRIAEDAIKEFNTNQSGLLTSKHNLLAWEKLPAALRENISADARASFDTEFPPDWPESEYLYIDAYLGDQSDSIFGAPESPDQYASIVAALVAPFGRGNVTIASADSSVNPIVNPNWLSDSRDQEFAV